ncbi:20727_t:CDS:2 [Cetraspora pellucida]|uniref:20727_t:CDS:1 n=1 Tax=Cetraspora pellucida TaxID=1433469 RepID=A0A9N9CE62_9GLOM|nr:20727_t:CDS:2 [Cetraspora pellucida]
MLHSENIEEKCECNKSRIHNQWIPFEDFTDIKQIGKGSFSKIYATTWTKGIIKSWDRIEKRFNRNENQTVALKVLKKSRNDIFSKFLKELQNIVKCQSNSHMHHIIQCFGVSQDPKTKDYIFVMPYMSNRSLAEYLFNNFKDIIWKMKRDFLRDIVTGIKWIHEKQIVHRDIHSRNILIDSGPNLVIADFGLSRPANDLDSSEHEICGIIPYIAPEVLEKKQYSYGSDIYSLGMIMWELTRGYRPFSDRNHDQYLILDICNGSRPIITKDTPHCWAILMQKCWHSDPLKRPTIDEIYYEVNSRYWNENESFIKEAEDERQGLFNAGKLTVNYMHPHSKTHSQLLNPIIDTMLLNLLQGSKSFTLPPMDSFRIGSDTFTIIPPSKKHSIEFLLNEDDYDEIKRRKLSDNEIQDSSQTISNYSYQIMDTPFENANSLNSTINIPSSKKHSIEFLLDENNYRGIALAKALRKNTTLTNLNLSYNELCELGGKVLAKALCKNNTLTNLDLSSNNHGESGGIALAKALCKNTALMNLILYDNKIGESGEKALADALCKNMISSNLDLRHIIV